MASFRRTSSLPAHQVGDSAGKEHAHAIAAPLISKSFPSGNSDHPFIISTLFPRSFGSLIYTLYKVQALVLGFFPKKSSSRPLKYPKGNIWRRVNVYHFLLCFLLGVFIGFTPFASPSFSIHFLSQNQAFYNEKLQPVERSVQSDDDHVVSKLDIKSEANDHRFNHGIQMRSNPYFPRNQQLFDHHDDQDPSFPMSKLLIIVTPIYGRSKKAYYINRLANTLRSVAPPLLWIAVEMASQSPETHEILRNSGVMFRHLVGKENLADMDVDRGAHLRNVALSHMETHKLNGIVFFANHDNVYTIDLFDQMRQIRRFGTWTVAKVGKEETEVMMEGPVCNGSKVLGWHTNGIMTNKFKRFHAGMSGFAFDSTILWDPKRWHKPSLEPVRFLYTVKEVFLVSTFIGQIVEDESQMEGFPKDCSRIMVWDFNMESLYSFLPRKTGLLVRSILE